MEIVLWVYVFFGMGELAFFGFLLAVLLLHPHARELLGAPLCDKCRLLQKK